MIIASPQNGTRRLGRRWFRLNLCALYILMTVAAAWLGFTMKRLRDQERAVARIEDLGGGVTYDYQVDKTSKIPLGEPPGPQWLRDVLGHQWNVCVIEVFLAKENGRVTDQDLAVLQSLPDLRRLYLNGNHGVTDDGLAYLAELSKLQTLGLSGCTIRGAGLEHLKKLPIVDLRISGTKVTDDQLHWLESMSNLEKFVAERTPITSQGMIHFHGLKELRELNLNRTLVDDAGLAYLDGLTKLVHLYLSDTKVTDEGVAKLKAALPNLKMVDQ